MQSDLPALQFVLNYLKGIAYLSAGPIEVQPAAGTGVTVELSHQQSSQMLANADSWLALAAARPSQVT